MTIAYNQALVLEKLHRTDDAVVAYKSLLSDHPTYTDCHLRLGCIAQAQGRLREASEHFKEVLQYNTVRAAAFHWNVLLLRACDDAALWSLCPCLARACCRPRCPAQQRDSRTWTLLAGLNMCKQQWQPAQGIYERLINQAKNRQVGVLAGPRWPLLVLAARRAPTFGNPSDQDEYAMLALGNVFFNTGKLKHAKEHYLKVVACCWLLVWDGHSLVPSCTRGARDPGPALQPSQHLCRQRHCMRPGRGGTKFAEKRPGAFQLNRLTGVQRTQIVSEPRYAAQAAGALLVGQAKEIFLQVRTPV